MAKAKTQTRNVQDTLDTYSRKQLVAIIEGALNGLVVRSTNMFDATLCRPTEDGHLEILHQGRQYRLELVRQSGEPTGEWPMPAQPAAGSVL